MWKAIGLAAVAAVVALAVFVATRPDTFRVERSIVIAAPADAVFPHVNALRRWEAWSPWQKLDPNATAAFEGPEAGEGAVMRWEGNRDVGKGSMTITESRPDAFIRFRLDFLEPFEASHFSDFTFQPAGGDGTTVTWAMHGENTFIGKAIGLIFDCEAMIGPQLEQGLQNLKAAAEAP